jgi:hypothetical protein
MDWTKAIDTPLGLAGFALALIFGVIAKWGPRYPKWLMPAAIILAAMTLIFALSISLRPSLQTSVGQGDIEAAPKAQSNTIHADQNGSIKAETKDACSPAQVGVNIGGGQNIQCEVQEKKSKSLNAATVPKSSDP